MLKEPPTSRQMLCLTGEREGPRGSIFPHLWGSGHTRRVAQEGMDNSPFSPHPGRAGRWKRKEKWVAGRSGKLNKRKHVGWLRLAVPGPGHQKPGPVPGDCAVGGASPGSARRGASLQSCCSVSAGRAGALAEPNASSSPFHPGHTLLLLLTEGSQPVRSPRGSVWVPNASSCFQALCSTDPSCCFLQGWTGSEAASHEPLMALICLSSGLTAARLVLDSRSHLKLQGSGLQSCPPSPTKAIQTLCLAGEGRANPPQTTPDTATLP